MPRGLDVSIILNPGDIYCMSEKTVGTDWKANLQQGWKNNRYTLRHAAGAPKYTTQTDNVHIKNQRKDGDVIVGDIHYKPKKSTKNPKPVWTKMPGL
jgi:hypothetical protein